MIRRAIRLLWAIHRRRVSSMATQRRWTVCDVATFLPEFHHVGYRYGQH
jgi:hypothetical protein